MKRLFPYLLILCVVVLFIANILCGSVKIPVGNVLSILFGNESLYPSWSYIIWESRFPQALTAMLTGAALSTSGLMLQTAFNNPLAGPDILGINSGAGLGAAIVLLLFGGIMPAGNLLFSGSLTLVAAAFVGALAVTALILLFASRLRSHSMLLIIGMMIGYVVSSAVSLLNFFSCFYFPFLLLLSPKDLSLLYIVFIFLIYFIFFLPQMEYKLLEDKNI